MHAPPKKERTSAARSAAAATKHRRDAVASLRRVASRHGEQIGNDIVKTVRAP